MPELFWFLWLTLVVAVAVWAHNKGLSGWGYFFLGLVATPLLSLAIVGTTDTNRKRLDELALRSGHYKRCFMCADLARITAIRCPHCSADLSNPPTLT